MAKTSVAPKITEPKGLTKRELRGMQRTWAAAVRELIKRLPVPPEATFRDMVAVFDSVIDKVREGRKILVVVGRAAKKKAVA
jgi:hypothetical protein